MAKRKIILRAGIFKGLGALGGATIIDFVEKIVHKYPFKDGDFERGKFEVEPGIVLDILCEGGIKEPYIFFCVRSSETEKWIVVKKDLLKLGWKAPAR